MNRLSSKTPLLFSTILCATAAVAAGDWPSFRGPGNDGVAAPGTPLVASLPADGLKPLWTSDPILSERDGGYASPVAADGRVYVYCCWRTKHPVEHRIIREENLADIGVRRPAGLSDACHAEIEAARISPERKAAAPDDLDRWMEKWCASHLSPEDRKAPGAVQYATDRLRRGDAALPVELLETLASATDRKFENDAALDAWAESQKIDPQLWRRQVRPKIPDYERTEEDMLFCLDAATGKTLWKYTQPSRSSRWSSSSTPCVGGGSVFFLGAQLTAYALDAATGAEKWKASLAGKTEPSVGANSSFVFADGKIFVLAGRLVALDASTGKILWEGREATGFSGSPVVWRNAGRTFVIAGERERCAFDASTGKLAWKVPGGGSSTPAVHGDLMALSHGHGLAAFRIAPDSAEKIAEIDKGGSKGGSPVISGNRVFTGSFEPACLDAETKSVAWSAPRGLDGYSSAALADGKLWCLGKGNLIALDAQSGQELFRVRVDFLKCASPAIADGKLYLRTRKNVVCFDLAKR